MFTPTSFCASMMLIPTSEKAQENLQVSTLLVSSSILSLSQQHQNANCLLTQGWIFGAGKSMATEICYGQDKPKWYLKYLFLSKKQGDEVLSPQPPGQEQPPQQHCPHSVPDPKGM